MGREEKKSKLNGILKAVFLIALITGIITLYIILNKGKIFGKRLIALEAEKVEKEITHSIQITTDEKYLAIGYEKQANLLVTIDGVDSMEGYELQLSDETLATVENNVVTPLDKEGVLVITAVHTEYNIKAETTIEIVKPITKLYLQTEYSSISIGEEMQLEYTFKPSTGTPKVEYQTSDENLATVDSNGIVTGTGKGTVTLTATDVVTGEAASCKLKITE